MVEFVGCTLNFVVFIRIIGIFFDVIIYHVFNDKYYRHSVTFMFLIGLCYRFNFQPEFSLLFVCLQIHIPIFTKLLRLLVLLWLDFANFYHTRIIGLISLCVFIRSLCQHIISVLRYTYRERLVGPSLKIYCSGSIFKREGERLHIGARTGTIKPVYLLPLPVAMSHSSQTALDEAEGRAWWGLCICSVHHTEGTPKRLNQHF